METKAINTKLKGHARVDVADVLRGLAVMISVYVFVGG